MAKFEAAQRHCHPSLDISRKEDERPVLDYHLKVAIQELEDQVKIRFRREDVQKLKERRSAQNESVK
jgi:hypothetical protein